MQHTPLLRNPLYKLGPAADHLECWVDGLLPPAPLLDVSAYLSSRRYTVLLQILWGDPF